MVKDVIVTISQTTTVGKTGFGIPLILASKADAAVEYETYDSAAAVGKKFETDSAVYLTAQLLFMQSNAPKKIAVCVDTEDAVTAITKLADKEWRQLIVLTGASDSTEAQIAALVETLESKIYFCSVMDKAGVPALQGKERTFVFFYDVATKYKQPVAAIVGEAAGRTPGSFTYKNLIIKGLEPVTTQSKANIEELHGKGAVTLLKKAGDIVTSDGIVSNGEYADIVDSKDYIVSSIEYDVQRLFNVNDKVPYTDSGITSIENAVLNVLKQAYDSGIIADESGTPLYSTSFPLRADTTEEDRSKRKYTMGNFEFTIAGAIHRAHITGELVI